MKRSFDKETVTRLKDEIEKAVNEVLKNSDIEATCTVGNLTFLPNEASTKIKLVINNSLSKAQREMNAFAAENGLIPVGRFFEIPFKGKPLLVTPMSFLQGKKKVSVKTLDGRKIGMGVDQFMQHARLELECMSTLSPEELDKIIHDANEDAKEAVYQSIDDEQLSKQPGVVDMAW